MVFFHEKLLLQCCEFDNLFNCLIEHAKANKSGTAGADRLPFVPRKTYEFAESSEAFNITSCQFPYYRKIVHVRPALGAFCAFCFWCFFFSLKGLNIGCISHICNPSAAVFICSPLWVRPGLTRLLLEAIKEL